MYGKHLIYVFAVWNYDWEPKKNQQTFFVTLLRFAKRMAKKKYVCYVFNLIQYYITEKLT